jgi:hypothetical protein
VEIADPTFMIHWPQEHRFPPPAPFYLGRHFSDPDGSSTSEVHMDHSSGLIRKFQGGLTLRSVDEPTFQKRREVGSDRLHIIAPSLRVRGRYGNARRIAVETPV